MESVTKAYSEVQERIARAAARSGRKPNEVRLVAVSKLQSVDKISHAVTLGQMDFGENYVQEWLKKKDELSGAHDFKLRWHLIGPLQRKKVKLVVGQCDLIQSVDRLELAQEISKVAVERGVLQDVLIQIHIGNEATKHGVNPQRSMGVLEQMASLSGIRICGMMVLPPIGANESEARGFLRESRGIFDRLKGVGTDFSILSMGTSHDFEWAIEEGATMVRVGTVIFGGRS